ncbi:MAG: phosphoglucosamine mutase [Lachnospiraceae bacterium]|nr:phosphoglucosamine mutase [Lachnospiraceae bacterium]
MALKYFGTDGFRGKANDTLRVEHALKIGQYLGYYYRKKHGRKAKCVIGKDTRRSSYMFEYGLSAGITSAGSDAYLMHVTTTPSVSYITKADKFDFGIMITASHNPYQDNGIKIFDRHGEKMDEAVLEEIEQYIDGELEIPISEEVGVCKDYFSGRNKYIGYLASISKESFRGYRIALDCANGASSMIAKNVFEMLGADLETIGCSPNGENINVDSGSTHIENLKKLVVEKECDIGFAFDGDADRCIMVNEKGNVVDGDGIMYIIASWLKQHNVLLKDKIAVTVMSNLGLLNALSKEAIDVTITDVGDKYIAKALSEEGLSIGGEQSGHIIVSKYENTGDGVLTAILVSEIMAARKCPASSMTTGLSILPQKLKNLEAQDKKALMEDAGIQAYIKETNESLKGQGRLLLRASGTEPLIRVMAEAGTIKQCDEIIENACEEIRKLREANSRA